MTPLRWTTIALAAAALWIFAPLGPSIILAAWTAALMRPLLLRTEKILKGRSRAAALLSLLIFVAVALPFVLVLVAVISGAQELFAMVQRSPSAREALEALAASDPNAEPLGVPRSAADFAALLQRVGAQGLGVAKNVAVLVGDVIIGLVVYFGGAYAFLIHGTKFWAWVKTHQPLRPVHFQRLLDAFQETGRGLLLGEGLTWLTQGVTATIIYLALGVPRALVLGPLTGLAAVIPLVGTSLVWIPVALGLLASGRPVKAAVLVGLGVFVVGSVDNFARPVFSKWGKLDLPLFVVVVSMFGGLALFGAWGVLFGPLIVRLAYEALTVSKESDPAVSPGPMIEPHGDQAR